MKKKFILSLFLIIAIFGVSFVRAANRTDITIEEQFNESQKTIVNEDIYEGNKEINQSNKTVNGNDFLVANKINIESQIINGDLYIFGNNVKITDDVVVNGNVFICASNIDIHANILRNAYIAGQYVSIGDSAKIGYSLFVAGEIVKIDGSVLRDVNLYADELEVSDSATISGNLNYSSTKEGKISDESVYGEVNFAKQIKKTKTVAEIVFDYVMDLIRKIVFVVLIFIFVLLVFPRFVNGSKEYIGKKLLKSIGIGLASLILIPFIAVILIFFNVTMDFGLLLIPVYILLLILSEVALVISISSKLADKFKKLKVPVLVPIVTACLWIIEQIPYINSIVIFFVILIGLGIIVQSVFKKKI